MHVERPVAQAIHNQLEGMRVSHVQSISTAGVIHVVATIVHQAIVRCVVDSPKTQGGSQVVSLSGMIVDNIDDDLDAFTMESLYHGFEFGHLLPENSRRRIAGLRRKKTD